MNRRDPNGSGMDKDRSGKGRDGLPSRSWSIEKRAGHKLLWPSRNSLGGLALDFERKLRETGRTDLVEHSRYVAMQSVTVSPNEYFRFRRRYVSLFQRWQNLFERDPLF